MMVGAVPPLSPWDAPSAASPVASATTTPQLARGVGGSAAGGGIRLAHAPGSLLSLSGSGKGVARPLDPTWTVRGVTTATATAAGTVLAANGAVGGALGGAEGAGPSHVHGGSKLGSTHRVSSALKGFKAPRRMSDAASVSSSVAGASGGASGEDAVAGSPGAGGLGHGASGQPAKRFLGAKVRRLTPPRTAATSPAHIAPTSRGGGGGDGLSNMFDYLAGLVPAPPATSTSSAATRGTGTSTASPSRRRGGGGSSHRIGIDSADATLPPPSPAATLPDESHGGSGRPRRATGTRDDLEPPTPGSHTSSRRSGGGGGGSASSRKHKGVDRKPSPSPSPRGRGQDRERGRR